MDHSKQKKIFEPDPSKPLSYKEWKRQQASGNGLVDNQNPLIFDNAQKKNVTFANENNKVNEKHNGNKPVSTNIPYIPIQSHDLDLSLCDQMAASNCRKLPVVNNRTTNSMAREQQTLQSKNPNLFKNPVNHILQQQANNANKLHSEQHFELEDAYRMLQLYHNNHGRPEINTTENLSPATTVKTANPAPPTKEITMTDLYQLMLKTLEVQNQNTQTNVQPDIVENISQPNQVYQSDEPKCSGCKQIVPKTAATNAIINDNGTVSTPEPTLKDLFQIILKQQEHLMNITKQLQCIVLMNNSPNPAIQPTYSNHNAFVTSNPATGVMTSLEINVQKCNNRPMSNEQDHTSNNIPNQMKYLNNYQNQEKHCCCDCKSPVHPKTFEAYEISDTSNDSSNADQEQVDHNEMQKENNYAFYGNILNQVNDVLKHSPPNITRNRQQIVQHQQPQMQSPQCPQSQKQQTPQYAAQDATQFNSFLNSNIRTANFRQIGFQFDDVNISATSKRYFCLKCNRKFVNLLWRLLTNFMHL